MGYHVYILQSETTGRYYCGQTNGIEERVRKHNDPAYRGTRTTKVFEGPWNLLWKEEYNCRGDAMRMERAIKKRGIARFLKERSESGGC
ncbi:MAG: GIY-YIG nuclease family protein [Alphaproteobacteria bacterium]|nr:GIY-YIG nuclease family protein [Alphaproteobacteria bacterium]